MLFESDDLALQFLLDLLGLILASDQLQLLGIICLEDVVLVLQLLLKEDPGVFKLVPLYLQTLVHSGHLGDLIVHQHLLIAYLTDLIKRLPHTLPFGQLGRVVEVHGQVSLHHRLVGDSHHRIEVRRVTLLDSVQSPLEKWFDLGKSLRLWDFS